MKPINVEILMGDSVGISDSYYRPTESDLLEDYLAIVNRLNVRLEAKTADAQSQLQQKDNRISQLEKQMAEMQESMKQIKESVNRNFDNNRHSAVVEVDEDVDEDMAKQIETTDYLKRQVH